MSKKGYDVAALPKTPPQPIAPPPQQPNGLDQMLNNQREQMA